MVNSIFLGGTCNGSTWREELIPLLKIGYFDPVVDNWDLIAQKREEKEKSTFCNIKLFVITPRMKGVFSIAEVIDCCHEDRLERTYKFNDNVITMFCFLKSEKKVKDGENALYNTCVFDKQQIRSLEAVGKMVQDLGGIWVKSLKEVVNYINNW